MSKVFHKAKDIGPPIDPALIAHKQSLFNAGINTYNLPPRSPEEERRVIAEVNWERSKKQERERCAKIAEDAYLLTEPYSHNVQNQSVRKKFGKLIAAKIREELK